ncbi:LuxR C-terminal-related transcriptional regulator [Neptunomonas antarctica]|uniref:Regulatory protein, luxR family n=1 Tax=Neptunomonas antarctica TaxID=619304 RepID=A0A1N7M2D2_9GAMM|nr:LuxR C-terminal-related transcriptional regulator [Neptunomonas antarctica]SIS80237.1 regulatory protein, luxR family [Neptunomonas antarctica]
MKLYIVSDNKEVKSRWASFAGDNSIEIIDADQLLLQKIDVKGCGLIHVNSIKSNILDLVCSQQMNVQWIALTDNPNDAEGLGFLQQGFRGYINTYVTASIFRELLEVIRRRDIWAGPSITQMLLKQFLVSPDRVAAAPLTLDCEEYSFTTREEEVLDSLITGASNKEIARKLGITERTVKAHVASLLSKTDTKDRLLLILKLAQQTV